MTDQDRIKKIRDFKDWVDQELEQTDTPRVLEAKKELREICLLEKQLYKLGDWLPEKYEKRQAELEEIIVQPTKQGEERKVLAQELLKLASQIKKKSNAALQEKPRKTKGPNTTLLVIFEDGTEYSEPKAVDTFIKTLQKFGLEKVAKLTSVTCLGHPLVSTTVNRKGQTPKLVDGFYIETCNSTENKKVLLQKVAKGLRRGIRIEVLQSDS